MMARFVFGLLTVFLALSTAQAQRRADPAPPPANEKPDAEAAPNRAPVTIDTLFERLSRAKDEQEGRAVATQIERRWLRSGSDTTDLLMGRAVQLMNAKDHERALDLLDYIVLLKPDWAEAYNKRATVFFIMDDIDGAMRDVRATLAREPRHFGALAGLGLIFQKLDQPKAAYGAFSQALKLHPKMDRLQGMIERLKLDVEDRKL